MRKSQTILTAALMVLVAGGAYFAGVQQESVRPMVQSPGPVILTGLTATPVNDTIANPTAVLLGEEKVPDQLLRPPAPPARPDLIVPDLKK